MFRRHGAGTGYQRYGPGQIKDIGKIAYELVAGAGALGIRESIYVGSIRRRNGQFGAEFRLHDKITVSLPIGVIVVRGWRLLRRLPGSSANLVGHGWGSESPKRRLATGGACAT